MLKRLSDEEIRAEAERVLPQLSRGERVLMAAEEGGYRFYDAKTLRPRTAARVPAVYVEAFARAEWIERPVKAPSDRRPSGYVLTKIGRAFLARLRAGDEPFSRQHRVREAGTQAPPRLIASQDSAVAYLRVRKGPNGEPFLSDAEWAAAERLHGDYLRSVLRASPASAWRGENVDLSTRLDFGPSAELQAAEAARSRFWHAVEAVGPELAPVLVVATCHLKSLESVEAALGLPSRSAKCLLKAALTALARHYGLKRSGDARMRLEAIDVGPLPL